MDVSNLRQVPDIWYPDGGIVLQAGNSLFRVYQGILSAQSSVFADIFNLAQSGDELVDQYDGQPLVVLHDEENEMEHFLKSMFDTSYLHDPQDLDECERLVGVLRLSHKYSCLGLKHRTLQYFTSRFLNSSPLESQQHTDPMTSVKFSRQSLFRMVSVCIETESLWLIPHLLFCISMSEKEIEPVVLEEWRDHPSLIIQYLRGIRYHSTFLQSTLRTFNFTCTSKRAVATCQEQLTLLRTNSVAQTQNADSFVKGLPISLRYQIVVEKKRIIPLKSRMCSTCFTELVSQHQSLLTKDWAMMPEFYGFPSWAELDEMKQKASG